MNKSNIWSSSLPKDDSAFDATHSDHTGRNKFITANFSGKLKLPYDPNYECELDQQKRV